jgi:hypothetical protein
MSYTFEQLKEDVRKEAEALRVHATKEERGELDFNTIDPNDSRMCIYGQMTGDCFSERAAILINKCTIRYFKDGMFEEVSEHGVDGLSNVVKGKKVRGFVKQRASLTIVHYSAIEAYILLPEANNASLISYLRGETETLTL